MIKRLLLSSLLLLANMAGLHAQSTAILIGPATNNGGFEDATPGPWTIVNGTRLNKWVIDGGATPGFTGTKAAYVSNGTTSPYPHTYDFTSSTSVFLYQDVTFPAGYSGGATLTFSAIQNGETDFDQAVVYISTGTPGAAPTAGTFSGTISALPALAGYQQLSVVPASTTSWTTQTISIPASAIGNSATTTSTRRIMFRWVSGSNTGTNPPIGIDNVNLTAACSGPVVTVSGVTASSATLNWVPVTGATSYQVRYRLSTDPITVPTWANPIVTGSTTFSLSGLTANSNYTYEVSALNGNCSTPTTGTFSTLCMLATIPYTENFEGITVNNTLPMCMVGITLGNNVLSYTANQGSLNRINHTPGGSKFVSFSAVAAPRYLFTPALDLDSSKTYRFSFWYIANNAAGLDTVRAVLSNSQAAADITFYAPAITNVRNTVYQEYFADVKPAFSGIQYFGISVKGTAAGSQFLTVDDLNITELTPCLGAPTATAPTGPATICANQPFTVTATGYNNIAGGLTFQWQSSTSCAGNWSDIPGATLPSYNVANGIVTSQAYRVVITCTNSGLSVTSPCLAVALTPFYICTCTSGATSTLNEDIGQVSIGGFFTNPAVSPIPPLTNNPLANSTYTDYTNLAPIPLVQATTYTLDVSQFSGGTIAATVLKGFIDYNHNSLFTDPNEPIDTIPSAAGSILVPSHVGSFTVPTTAQVGITKLRFVLSRSAAGSVVPCGTYGTGETEDYLVEISGTPVPPQLTNSGAVCGGDTVVITAVANILTSSPGNAPQYSLTGPGIIGTLTNTTGVFRVATPRTVSSAQYIARVQAYGQFSDTISTTVTVYPNPNIAIGAVVNPTACLSTDGSITLQNLGTTLSYTLQYLRNGVLVTVPGITPNASGNYVLSGLDAAFYDKITVVNTNGCSAKVVGPVSLVAPGAPPTPNATANTPVCLGSTLTLTVSNPNPAGSYNWFGPNNFIATGTTVTRSNISYADTGIYYVTVNIAGCKSVPRAIRVDITSPSPAPTATNPQQFCQFSTGRNLTAFGSNLLFYTTATGGNGSASLSPNTAVVGTFTYYVTQNTTGCPSNPRTPITVIITPQPTAPLVPYDTVEYCQFDNPVALLAYGPNQKYYTSPTGGFGTSSITPSTTNFGITTYYASQTINGCEGPRTPIVVIVKPKPAPPVVTSPIDICQYTAPQQLTAQGQNLLWYDVPTGGTGLSIPPSPPTGREATTTYYVVQSLNGCESDRAAITVNVNYLPNATFVPSKNYVCVEDTISFIYYGNARPNANYIWTVPPSAQIVSGNNSQGPLVVRFNDTGTYEVRLVVENKGCFSGPSYQQFEVRPRPEVRINAKRELCIGEVTEITLDSLSDNISNFSWSFGDGEVVYGTQSTGPYGVRWNTPGTKTIVVNSISRQCGSFPHAESFTVRPAPAASILNKPTAYFCSGDSIRLQAKDLGPGYSYEWTPAGLFNSFERAGTTVWAVAPATNGAIISAIDIILTVTDTVGCKGTDTAKATTIPCCAVFLPTAFTPNGDGTNDVFSILRAGGNPQISAFRIYNRLGNVVFETANSQQGWDGNFVGDPQPMEVYFYYVKYRCAGVDYEKKGEITLIR